MLPPLQKWAIRGMEPGEAGAAASFIAAAFSREAAGLGLGEPQWAALLATELESTHPSLIKVAARDGALVGVLVLRREEDEAGHRKKARAPWWAPYSAMAAAAGLPAAARLALRDAIMPETVEHGELLIEYLCVCPTARRQGVAGALLGAAAGLVAGEQGEKKHRLGLWVAASNTAAMALYAQAGFTVTARTKDAGWVTRAACAFFLGEGRGGWLKMEKVVGVAGKKDAAALPLSHTPVSPRLASYRPSESAFGLV